MPSTKKVINQNSGMLFSFFYPFFVPLRYFFQQQRWAIAIILVCFCITTTHANNNQNAMMQAMFAKAFGKKTNIPSKSTADIQINNVNYEQQVTVYTNEDGDGKNKTIDRVEAIILLALFEDVLTEDFFKKIQKQLKAHKKITFSQLTEMGINTSYNMATLSLEILIKPELQKPRILTIQHNKSATLRASNRLQASEFGGYLNLYSNLSTSTTLAKPSLRLRLEGSLNIQDYVIESTASKESEQWVLGNTILTYDRPDKLYRYQVGNISTQTKGFQDNYSLIGISLNKSFFMDTELHIKPKANSTFILTTRSEVEVYLNGKPQKKFHLDKGKYTLEDIGLLDGSNNIDIKITDEFGKITHKKTNEYYDNQLLKPKLSTFTSNLGTLKDLQEKTNIPLTKKLIFSGYYQQGLYKNLTMGIDLQFSHKHNLIGTEVITSNALGRIKLNVGLSHRKEGKIGQAISFTYYPEPEMFLTNTGIEKFIRTVNFRGEYRSQYFDQLTTKTETTNLSFLQHKLQANLVFNLGKQWDANLVSGFSRTHNEIVEKFTTASLSRRFHHNIKWNISIEYQENNTDDELRVQTQVQIPLSRPIFSRQQDATLHYDSQTHHFSNEYTIHQLGAVGKNSLGGKLRYTHNDTSQQFNTELHYKNNQFAAHLNSQHTTASQQLNMSINSSLLCAESNCTLSYPISDSFALVKGPTNQDKPIAIKNGYGRFHYPDNSESDLPDNYSALITDKTSQAVVLLESYKYQRISIDEGGLPFGYDPEKTEFEFIPRYHSSFTLVAGGKPGTVVTGMLLDKNKQGLGFKGGQWVAMSEEGKIIAFFTNKAGHFHLPSVPVGRYKIELFDHPTMTKIIVDIPDKQDDIYSVGELNMIEN